MSGIDIPGLEIYIEPILYHLDDFGIVINLSGSLAYKPFHPHRTIILDCSFLRSTREEERYGKKKCQSN